MIIFRYLAKQILSSVIVTSLVVMFFLVINAIVHYMNDVMSGKISVHAVFLVTVLQMPMLLGYILPIGLFLAILLTLGRLANDHERVVLSACGLSKLQITYRVMVIAFIVFLVDSLLMLYVEPLAFQYRTDIVLKSAKTISLNKVFTGKFQTFGDSKYTLLVGQADKRKGEFENVFLISREAVANHGSQVLQWDLLTAESVVEKVISQSEKYFVFNNGYRYSGTPGRADFQVTQFKHYQMKLPVLSYSLRGRYQTMPTSKLYSLYVKGNYIATMELQWRIAISLSTLVFALLAIPLGEVEPRQGKYVRIVPALLLYTGFINSMFLTRSWLLNGKLPIWVGFWWILLALLIITLLLCLHQQRFLYKFRFRGKWS